MYTGPERGRFHEWAQQKRSRRSILRGISEVVLAVSAVGTVGYVAIQAMRGSEVLKGEPTTGEIKKYVTKMNGFTPPLLRGGPSLSENDEIGTVEPGIVVRAMEIRDTPYGRNPDLCGNAEDGRYYCKWYELKDPVPVRRPDGPIELRTGVLAGTFVDPIEESRAQK